MDIDAFLYPLLYTYNIMLQIITRNFALCIYYQLPYTSKGLKLAKKQFADLEMDYEICYLTTAIFPRLVSRAMVEQNPLVFHLYPAVIKRRIPPNEED